jgi:hypothetical protein
LSREDLITELNELDIPDTEYFIDSVEANPDEDGNFQLQTDRLWFVCNSEKSMVKSHMSKFEDIYQRYCNEHTKRK